MPRWKMRLCVPWTSHAYPMCAFARSFDLVRNWPSLGGHSPTKSRTQLLPTTESKRFGHMIFSRPNGFHASFHANKWHTWCFHGASGLVASSATIELFFCPARLLFAAGRADVTDVTFSHAYERFQRMATVCSRHPCLSQIY